MRNSFAAPGLRWKVFTAERWDILNAMCGAEPLTVGEIDRRDDREVKSLRTKTSQLVVPYESAKVDFLLQAA